MFPYDNFTQSTLWNEIDTLLHNAENSPQWIEQVEDYLGIKLRKDIHKSESGMTYDFTWHEGLVQLRRLKDRVESDIKKKVKSDLTKSFEECKKLYYS